MSNKQTMDLQEIKNIIAIIESAEKNISNYEALKGRELMIMATTTEYYKEFQEWKKTKGGSYRSDRSEKGPAPMYIGAEKASELLDILISHQQEFCKPHKEKLLGSVNQSK